ncbi:hypothetical protein [Rhizobium sp. N324]|uniref:hypothetical protein n=1 Tax=Rhizobium sp. N324 TaxID=1703969 RepID=UPI0007EB6736|nr:hypothetical protein [Rhizobium sp. N324]ANM12085.1 hypothetical protein AMK05_CH03736 [Rhizobium sp. N324]
MTWLYAALIAAIAEGAVIIAVLFWLVRRDNGRHKDITAAIEFALGLNLFRQRNFLRLFVDGEDATLKRDYPEWAEYRAQFHALEGF